MATVVRKSDANVTVWASAHNALKAQIGAGTSFHLDKSETTVTAATAADLPTSIALCNNIIAVLRFHFADTLALKAADATISSLPAIGAAVDLASAEAAANTCKSVYNTHCGSATYHYTADATNTTTAVDSTDQASLNTLLNEMKGDINAHLASAPACASFRILDI